MSIVLEALSKAEKEKKQGIFNQYHDKKMDDIKSSYQKLIGWIIALNVCIIVILLFFLAYYLFHKNEKPFPVEVKTLDSLVTQKTVPLPPQKVPEQFVVYRNYIQLPDGPEIKISGRIVDGNNVYILVGPEMYKVGDSIGDVRVTEIQSRKIKIKYKEQEYEIPTV